MKNISCCINQPYFFPYFGFFHLIAKADHYVSLDDVNMIKKGYIHRNSIIMNNREHMFTVPIKNLSQNRKINETYPHNLEKFLSDFRKKIAYAYGNYPYYFQVEKILLKLEVQNGAPISELSETSIALVSKMLGLNIKIIKSSELNLCGFSGQERIIRICKALNAKRYFNLPSGENLYRKECFELAGIELDFIKTDSESFKKYFTWDGNTPSILDALAKFPAEEIAKVINEA